MSKPSILVVNPGSTSTKIGLAYGSIIVDRETIRHSSSDLEEFRAIWDQLAYRTSLCRAWARERRTTFDAVAGIGGLLRPLKGGTYGVNEAMLVDAKAGFQGNHASNLGCAIAHELAREFGTRAFVVDPVSVNEFEPLARLSGHPRIERNSLSHALNLHATARRVAEQTGKPLSASTFIIAHLGGGISIAPLVNGRIIDVNDASSDGPFSPERSGGLPLQPLVDLCFSGTMTEKDIRSMIMGRGGLVAYLGTNSAIVTEDRIRNGDAYAKQVYEAMAYQIAKEIGAMATVVRGKLDAIVLTGGLAGSGMLTAWIEERVKFIAPVMILPDEDELGELAAGVARVLGGDEKEERY